MTSVTSVPETGPLRAPLTRLPSLTGLRWIAAFLVFGFHVGTLGLIAAGPWEKAAWDKLFGHGASGVSFFFVLSGVVLAWSARPGDTKRGFWQRRIAKIYPNHLVTFLIVLAIMFAWGDQISPGPTLANLFLVQTWTWVPGYQYSINSVSWSLCCELFFYLCLPFVLPLLRRFPTWLIYGGLAGVMLVILLMSNSLGIGWFPIEKHLVPEYRWWFTQMFPPVRSLEFFTGVLAGVLLTRRQWYGPGLWTSTAIFVVLYAACTFYIPGSFAMAVLTLGYLVLICGAAKRPERRASPWRWRWMVWLGEVSFAFYLVHVALIQNVLRLLDRNVGWAPLPALGVILLAIAGSLRSPGRCSSWSRSR